MSRLSQFIPNVTNVALTTFSGTGTFTKNSSDLAYVVQVWGGGGSGGHGADNTGAGGGGGGAFNEVFLYASGVPQTVTVTVGAGGPSVSGIINTEGRSGGTSSFGSYVSAYGGTGGSSANGSWLGGVGGGTLSGSFLGTDGTGPDPGRTEGIYTMDSTMGGGAGGFYTGIQAFPGGSSYYGGGGGGYGGFSYGEKNGGNSVYGGGGGGAALTSGGFSVYGGSGSAGARYAAIPPASIPAGGGGGRTVISASGLLYASGPGARGQVLVYAFRGKPQ
jgi:hypothetical protein